MLSVQEPPFPNAFYSSDINGSIIFVIFARISACSLYIAHKGFMHL